MPLYTQKLISYNPNYTALDFPPTTYRENTKFQARLPGATAVEEIVKKTTEGAKVYANNMVRVDPDVQKINKFFPTVAKELENKRELVPTETDTNNDTVRSVVNDKNEDEDIFEEDAHMTEEITDKNNELIPNIVIDEADEEVLGSSVVNEPSEAIKHMPDRWKGYTAADQANATYIDPKESFKTRTFKYERIETKLTSVKQLRLDVENKCNSNLREILANLIFIACIDCHKSLIQHSTKLYLCDTTRLSYVYLVFLTVEYYQNVSST